MRNLVDWAKIGGPIPEVNRPTVESFAADWRGKPCILKGVVPVEPYQGWTLDYLKSVAGSSNVHCRVSRDGTFPGGRRPWDASKFKSVELSFAEFLDRVHGLETSPILAPGEKYYLYQEASKVLQPLADQVPRPAYIPAGVPLRSHFWISAPGNVTPIHFDMEDNFLVQLVGRKVVRLWHPDQYRLLYINPYGTVHDLHTRMDAFDHRPDDFPKFEEARALAGDLAPGDVLYIPACWMHYVVTTDFSISANFWWQIPEIVRLRAILGQLQRGELGMAELRTEGVKAFQARPELGRLFAGMLGEVDIPKLIAEGLY